MLIGKMLKKSNIVLVMLFDYGTPERHHTDLNIIRIVSPYQGLNDLSVVHVIALYKEDIHNTRWKRWKDTKEEQYSTRYAFRLRNAREASYRLEYHTDRFSISRTK